MFPGHLQMLILLLIVLLLFGKKIPTMMRSLGQGVTEFKEGLHGVDSDKDNKDDKKIQEEEKQDA